MLALQPLLVEGGRQPFVCCPAISLPDMMRLSVLYSGVATLETAACPAFLPPIAPPLPNWVVLHGALELLRDHRADHCGPGQLGCFLQAFFWDLCGGSHLE